MSASVISGQRERLMRKKSKRHWISRFSLVHVKRVASGISTRQISASSKLPSLIASTSSLDFKCVVATPSFLSLETSQTKMKSPPKATKAHSKEHSLSCTFLKKAGLSSLGA